MVGICLDPINNGNVTYVALKDLQNATGILKTNTLMVKINPSVNRVEILDKIKAETSSGKSEFEVLELNEILNKNLDFLGYVWSPIMFLPFFSLASASLCFIGYVTLALTEQRKEFGVLRALGVNSKTILKIVIVQNLVVLLSSYTCGVAFGTIITLLILVLNPAVTSYTVIQIVGMLLAILMATFTISLYPAIKFAHKPPIEIMA
ncbi:MAG: ABC transporter permease [Candidatus Bathyarchaeia archaeon]